MGIRAHAGRAYHAAQTLRRGFGPASAKGLKERAPGRMIEALIGHRILDSYEMVRVIGRGATGTVYEAKQLVTGERVAIKWMHARAFSADDSELLRFTQEARIVAALGSPHVPRAHELGRDPETGVPFQVMELLAGEDVGSLLGRTGALAPEAALKIAAQACEGLKAAHTAGIVHRDIKPENLFLARQKDGTILVKLLDFGVAKIRRASNPAGAGASITAPLLPMTESGQVMGTPLYMAVELLDGAKHADARSDVYSMGITLYALLAGAPPRASATSLVALLNALVNEPVVPLLTAAPWVSTEVAAIVDKAIQPEKEARYRDGGELLAAVCALLPQGSALREDMLVPVAEQQRRPAKGPEQGGSQSVRDPLPSSPRKPPGAKPALSAQRGAPEAKPAPSAQRDAPEAKLTPAQPDKGGGPRLALVAWICLAAAGLIAIMAYILWIANSHP